VTEAFLLGAWLGGAICYATVLSSGDKVLSAGDVVFCAAFWLYWVPYLFLTAREERRRR
jgi:hypothetical protein